jgi:hypothetical protein
MAPLQRRHAGSEDFSGLPKGHDAANETMAVETADERVGPAGSASLRQGYGRLISPDEELVTLTEATKHLPKVDGKKVSVCTLWRWCRLGLRGVSLEYVRVGRKICTTREALLRFFSELADLDNCVQPDIRSRPAALRRSPITSRERQHALAEADAVLERAGI